MFTSLRDMQLPPFDRPDSGAHRSGRNAHPIETGHRCERCARPHNRQVRCLPDGRWFDGEGGTWRDAQGVQAPWPDIVDYSHVQHLKVVLAASLRQSALDDTGTAVNLILCQRCRPLHRREEHRRHSRITAFKRKALGDLFQGSYPA